MKSTATSSSSTSSSSSTRRIAAAPITRGPPREKTEEEKAQEALEQQQWEKEHAELVRLEEQKEAERVRRAQEEMEKQMEEIRLQKEQEEREDARRLQQDREERDKKKAEEQAVWNLEQGRRFLKQYREKFEQFRDRPEILQTIRTTFRDEYQKLKLPFPEDDPSFWGLADDAFSGAQGRENANEKDASSTAAYDPQMLARGREVAAQLNQTIAQLEGMAAVNPAIGASIAMIKTQRANALHGLGLPDVDENPELYK